MSITRGFVMRLGAALLVAAMGCTGAAFAVGKSDAPNDAWSLEADCGLCHSVQADSLKGIAPQKEAPKVVVPPGRAASVKQDTVAEEGPTEVLAAKHGLLDCAFCHDDEQALAAVHEGVTEKTKAPKALEQTEVDPETCLSCHGSMPWLYGRAGKEDRRLRCP